MLNAELQMFKSVSVTKPITADRLSVLPDLYGNILSSLNAVALLHQFFQQIVNAPDVLLHNRIVNVIAQFLLPRYTLFPCLVLAVFVSIAFLRVFDDFKSVCKRNFIGYCFASPQTFLVGVPVLSVHIVRAYSKMIMDMPTVDMGCTQHDRLFPESPFRPFHSDLVSFFGSDLPRLK